MKLWKILGRAGCEIYVCFACSVREISAKPTTAYDVSRFLQMSHPTARKLLREMVRDGKLIGIKVERKNGVSYTTYITTDDHVVYTLPEHIRTIALEVMSNVNKR